MMYKTVVIALSGKKGSGKNTLATFIKNHFSQEWYKGVRTIEYCKEYAFADLLKEFCIDVLGLTEKQCYGSDEDKNTLTKYRWDKVGLHREVASKKRMTARDVMQIFGTECVRSWFGNVWAEATLRRIAKDKPVLAIITDNRFPSEIEKVLGHPHGYIIRLTRSPYTGDEHSSETSLDGFDWNKEKCYVLDNASLSKEEQKDAAVPILRDIFGQEFEK